MYLTLPYLTHRYETLYLFLWSGPSLARLTEGPKVITPEALALSTEEAAAAASSAADEADVDDDK